MVTAEEDSFLYDSCIKSQKIYCKISFTEMLQKRFQFCSSPRVTTEVNSILWGFCNLFSSPKSPFKPLPISPSHSRYLGKETILFTETSQNWFQFCSFLRVTTEVNSILWGFCNTIVSLWWLQKKTHFCMISVSKVRRYIERNHSQKCYRRDFNSAVP